MRLVNEEDISLAGIKFMSESDHCEMIGRLNSAQTINAIIIPDNATNGDVVKLMFPDAEIQPIMGYFDKDELLGYRVYLGGRSQDYLLDWWNAPYKKEVEE